MARITRNTMAHITLLLETVSLDVLTMRKIFDSLNIGDDRGMKTAVRQATWRLLSERGMSCGRPPVRAKVEASAAGVHVTLSLRKACFDCS